MNDMNDIMAEIHRVREKQAAECDYDVHKIGERMRRRQREEMSHGVRYVSFAEQHREKPESCLVREDPPRP